MPFLVLVAALILSLMCIAKLFPLVCRVIPRYYIHVATVRCFDLCRKTFGFHPFLKDKDSLFFGNTYIVSVSFTEWKE